MKTHALLRRCPTLWACTLLLATPAQAQTGLLNDTGQTSCYNASNVAVACDAATAGNTGTRPHQDARYGRDAAAAASQLSKTGGGAAGFDYSCVRWNGTVVSGSNCTAGLVANTTGTASGTPATDWACTKDNTTGLVWSLQTQTASWNTATSATYPNAGHNTPSRRGYSAGWRLPTRRELLGIVHNGLPNYSTAMVDVAYFPNTQADGYWTSDTYAPNPSNAWIVDFYSGYSRSAYKADGYFVRFVRSGQ